MKKSVVLDFIEWQLFYHDKTGEFLLLPLESGKCDTISYQTANGRPARLETGQNNKFGN
jgi:hypothetical protein